MIAVVIIQPWLLLLIQQKPIESKMLETRMMTKALKTIEK